MKTFKIEVTETVVRRFDVDAENEDAALDAAEEVFCGAEDITFVAVEDRNFRLVEA